MAPEQLQGNAADARSDIFAFGCVLYEMLSGKRAFSGANAASLIAAIMEREPAPLDIAPPLDRVIKKCLTKDPDERFQTARDLKYSLGVAMEQPVAPVTQTKQHWWMAVVTLLAGLLAGAGLMRINKSTADVPDLVKFQISPPEGGYFVSTAELSPDGRAVAFVANVKFDHCNAAGEFRQAFLQLLTIVIGGGFFQSERATV